MNVLKALLKKIALVYLKSFPNRKERMTRASFLGARLKIKQYHWLHFNNHPYELNKEEK